MSSGTRRQDHDRADAYDYVRQMINLKARQYTRRWKAAAEAHVDEVYQRAALTGQPFDFKAAGDEALAAADAMFISAEAVPELEEDTDGDPETPAA